MMEVPVKLLNIIFSKSRWGLPVRFGSPTTWVSTLSTA